jgi:predicted metal-binding membrane protein
VSLGALIVLAWLSLVVWGLSPYGRFLSHEDLGDVSFGDGYWIVLFVVGWTLMTMAMMLPTSWPLLGLFSKITQRREDHAQLVALVIGGYLSVWMLFGVLVHIGDRFLHEAVEANVWLNSRAWVIGSATLLVAGAYQFTPLKYYCLEKCRSPFAFVTEHWHGRDARREALRLGLSHGIFCLGCCWSLMLLMFAVGVGNLAWMFLLGTLMSIEKNATWGRRLSAPLGVWLLASSLSVALVGTSLFQ